MNLFNTDFCPSSIKKKICLTLLQLIYVLPGFAELPLQLKEAPSASLQRQGQAPFDTGLPLYYWRQPNLTNFGDYISLKIVERIVDDQVPVYTKTKQPRQKLLAVGSILYFAQQGDVVWGSGINGKRLNKQDYSFCNLDVRSVRGPLTRAFLKEYFDIDSPEIYGDPALLMPYLFPEFVKSETPVYEYLIIPHYSELNLFPKSDYPNVVFPTESWDIIIAKILQSQFVISSSLHGIIIAEAYGIPARWLRVTENEPPFKYFDYYLGTKRFSAQYATSIEEALLLGGEKPFQCDLKRLYYAFPIDYWPGHHLKKLTFSQ